MASFQVTGKEAEFNQAERSNEPSPADANNSVSLLSENVFCFMDHAYTGNGGFRDGRYLVPHSRELFYKARQGFSHYVNFVKPVVRAMVEPCFVDEAKREYTDDVVVDAFIEDVDNKKTPIQRFVHSAMNVCRRHSVVFIVVDNHSSQPVDQATAVEKRILPYLYIRKANQLDTYTLDEYGNILEIAFIEKYEKRNASGIIIQQAQYRMWTLTDTYLYQYDKDARWNISDQLPQKVEIAGSRTAHNLGVVPVVVARDVELEMSDNFLPDPKLYDIARVNHSIYNKDSEIRELERNQAFAILCVQQDKRSSLTVGSSNVLFYPIGANVPQFVAPPMEVLAQLTTNREKLREDLFRLAEQNGIVAVQDAKSGLALAYEFFAHESVLQETSRIAEKMEEDIFDIFNKWTSKNIDYEVVYRSSFVPHGEDNRIKLFDTVLSQQGVPKKMIRDILIDEYKLLFPRFEPEDIEELEKEFDEDDAKEKSAAENSGTMPGVGTSEDDDSQANNMPNAANLPPSEDNNSDVAKVV